MITNKHKILIARHGETDGNKYQLIQTRDTPLNDIGFIQAEQLANDLMELGTFDQVISSSLLRAKQTARVVSTILNISTLQEHELFCERDQGIFKGLSHNEVIVKYPEYYDHEHQRVSVEMRPPEGENFDDLKVRARQAIEVINSLSANTIIVSHGGFIRALMEILGRKDEVPTSMMKNGQIFKLN